jgi:hypothetical protein
MSFRFRWWGRKIALDDQWAKLLELAGDGGS